MIKKIILIIITLNLILPIFSLAITESPIKMPETLEESQKVGERAIELAGQEGPGIIKRIFYQEILPVWYKVWFWIKTHFCSKIINWLKPIIQERISIFKERFPEEKEELKQEIKTEVPNWWQRLKEFFK